MTSKNTNSPNNPQKPLLKDRRKILKKWLKSQMAHGKKQLYISLFFGYLQGISIIIQTGILAYILAYALNAQSEANIDFSFQVLTMPLLAFFIIISLRTAFGWLSEYTGMVGAIKIKSNLRVDFLDHLAKIGPSIKDTTHSGSLATIAYEQIEAVEGYYARYWPQLGLTSLLCITILFLAFTLNWVAGLLLLTGGLLVPIFMALIGHSAASASRAQFTELNRLGGYFLDRLKGLKTLKIFGRTTAETQHIKTVAEDYRQRTMKVLRLAFLSGAVLEFFSALGIAMIALLVGLNLLKLPQAAVPHMPEITPFIGLFLLLLAPEFYMPLRKMAAFYHDRASAIAAADLLEDFFSQKTMPQKTSSITNSPKAENNILELQDINLTYKGRNKAALKNICLNIPKGKLVILSGQSGSGKSSLIDIILGFRQADSGIIRREKTHKIAWISQKPYIFYGSLADNLRIAEKDASSEDMIKALKEADFHNILDNLPKGLDSLVGEAAIGLSGGEARRLALARACLSGADLLLLDEPTASLDAKSETEIMGTIQKLSQKGKSLIIATHSPKLAAIADIQVVLENGKIISQEAKETSEELS